MSGEPFMTLLQLFVPPLFWVRPSQKEEEDEVVIIWLY